VAIDRASRLLFFKVYQHKTAAHAEDFLKRCLDFFPFYITHVLTDNGAEFTDRFVSGKGEESGNHRHGGLKKELKVRTPLEALDYWYKLSSELFKILPDQFRAIYAPKTQ
jgi:transposase-like protein